MSKLGQRVSLCTGERTLSPSQVMITYGSTTADNGNCDYSACLHEIIGTDWWKVLFSSFYLWRILNERITSNFFPLFNFCSYLNG